MYFFLFKPVKSKTSIVDTMRDNIMRKECAIIVTIKMEERKNHGNVNMKNCTQTGCVRTVTLTNTIK